MIWGPASAVDGRMIRDILQNEKANSTFLEESAQIIEEICVRRAEGMCDQGLGGIVNVITVEV